MKTEPNCQPRWKPWDIPLDQILSIEELASITFTNYLSKENAIIRGRKTPVIDWMVLNTSLWGLRISESAFLECGQIHINENTSYLHLIHTKGSKPRYVVVNTIFAIYLKEHLLWKKMIGEPLHKHAPFFYSHSTKTFMTPEALRKAFKRAIKRGGVSRNVTPHSGRHSMGTHMAVANSIEILQKVLGHSSIATTEIYIHALTEHHRKFAEEWGKILYQEM